MASSNERALTDFATHATRAAATRVLTAAKSSDAITADEAATLKACAEFLRQTWGWDLCSFAVSACVGNPNNAAPYAAQIVAQIP